MPLHLEAGPIWWYAYFNQEMHNLTWRELVELGAPKNGGPILGLETQCDVSIEKLVFHNVCDLFQRTKSVGLCGNLNCFVLEYARPVGLYYIY
jgi:hypothetical protein